MAKVKETKVAIRGENPRKAPKASQTARKVPPPHEEVKAESGSDSSDSQSSSGSDSESELEKQKSTKKPDVRKAKKSEPNSPPVADDSSDDSSSSDDSEDDSSSSEGEAMKAMKSAKSSKKDNKKKDTPAAVSTNGKVSKSTEKVDSSDDDSSEDEEMADAHAESTNTAAAKASEPVDPTRAVAPQPFEPPAGYKTLDISKANAKTLSSLLSNPSSKQIWHITAPSSVPISELKSVSLAAIQNQSSVLTHKSASYALAEEKESKTTKKVLLPASGGKGYAATELPVSKSLVLQQVLSIPKLETSASRIGPKPPRSPRKQPKGLRMRYKPTGFGSGDPGTILGSDESEDDEDVTMTEPPAFKAPKGSAQREREKEKERKRKRDEKDAAEEVPTPRTEKKRRKERKGVSADETMEVMPGQESTAARIEESLIEGTKEVVPRTVEEKARIKAEKKERRKSKDKKN
ncbi:hypothetical protein AAFC00_006620 [Neodothiora populina]|uniref:Uncharacterized protein n=1 Tax=Neodothiora populina TaxID=2781224 RepID=A0ABR3PAV1_9PEZI